MWGLPHVEIPGKGPRKVGGRLSHEIIGGVEGNCRKGKMPAEIEASFAHPVRAGEGGGSSIMDGRQEGHGTSIK